MLQDFRHNVAPLREALARLASTPPALDVGDGHPIESPRFQAYQRLSGPVRRSLRPADRVSFTRVLEEMRVTAGAPHKVLHEIEGAWRALQNELDTPIALGGNHVPRRQIVNDWLEAVTFSNRREFKDSYTVFLERWNIAGEALAVQLVEQAAAILIRLDDVLAEMLDEPATLPPAAPFVERAERTGWWRRWFS